MLEIVERCCKSGHSESEVQAALEELGALTRQRTMSILQLVDHAELFLVSMDDTERSRATQMLTKALEHCDSFCTTTASVTSGTGPSEGVMNADALSFLVQFYTSRLHDFFSVSALLEGLAVLCSRFQKLRDQDVLPLTQSLFADIKAQSLSHSQRQLLLRLVSLIVDRYPEFVVQQNDDFLAGFLSAVENERDPRCLVLAFAISAKLGSLLLGPDAPSVELAGDLWEILSCYFPIMFKPPKNDKIGIAPKDLRDGLRVAMASSPHFLPYLVPFMVEKMLVLNGDVLCDAYDTLNSALGLYDAKQLSPYLGELVSATTTSFLTIPPMDDHVVASCLSFVRHLASVGGRQLVTLFLRPALASFKSPHSARSEDPLLAQRHVHLVCTLLSASEDCARTVINVVLTDLCSAFPDRPLPDDRSFFLHVMESLALAAAASNFMHILDNLQMKTMLLSTFSIAEENSASDVRMLVASTQTRTVFYAIPGFVDTPDDARNCIRRLVLWLGLPPAEVKGDGHVLASLQKVLNFIAASKNSALLSDQLPELLAYALEHSEIAPRFISSLVSAAVASSVFRASLAEQLLLLPQSLPFCFLEALAKLAELQFSDAAKLAMFSMDHLLASFQVDTQLVFACALFARQCSQPVLESIWDCLRSVLDDSAAWLMHVSGMTGRPSRVACGPTPAAFFAAISALCAALPNPVALQIAEDVFARVRSTQSLDFWSSRALSIVMNKSSDADCEWLVSSHASDLLSAFPNTLFPWIVKAFVTRNDSRAYSEFVPRLLENLSRSSVAIVLDDSPLMLYSVALFQSNISVLYRQRFFMTVLPLLLSKIDAMEPSHDMSVCIANLADLCSHVPFSVLSQHVQLVVQSLAQILSSESWSGDAAGLENVLATCREFVINSPLIFSKDIRMWIDIVSRHLTHSSMTVRIAAVRVLHRMALTLETAITSPYKKLVSDRLRVLLDDRKRPVRIEAANARSHWVMLVD
eukprot:ANDGO_02364.mRNA.1 MMS19 nucleotide excision repair protein homolog